MAKITFERVPNVGKHADEWTIRANGSEAGCLFRDNKTGDWFWLAGFAAANDGFKLSANTHIDLPSGIPVHAAKRLVRDALQNTGSIVHHTGRFNERGDEVVVAIITTREGSGPAVCALTNEETSFLVHFGRPAVDKFAGEDVERDESIREMDIAATIRVADKGLAASYSWICDWDALDRDFVRPTETETCSDCDGTTLRLDTTTGAVDCVDCGNETTTIKIGHTVAGDICGVTCRGQVTREYTAPTGTPEHDQLAFFSRPDRRVFVVSFAVVADGGSIDWQEVAVDETDLAEIGKCCMRCGATGKDNWFASLSQRGACDACDVETETETMTPADIGVAIPFEVINVNTVRDAAARLRETSRLMGSDSAQAQKKRRQLRSWIAHALASKEQGEA
tara:strand:+ start:1855 stop:3036 length:1182 start_codon:yes stop_codon:yes gene_type:complete